LKKLYTTCTAVLHSALQALADLHTRAKARPAQDWEKIIPMPPCVKPINPAQQIRELLFWSDSVRRSATGNNEDGAGNPKSLHSNTLLHLKIVFVTTPFTVKVDR
jgi:hypothetical protein